MPDVDMLIFFRGRAQPTNTYMQQLGRELCVLVPVKQKSSFSISSPILHHVAEVDDLPTAQSDGADVEHLGVGPRIIQFSKTPLRAVFSENGCSIRRRFFLRDGEPDLELPEIDYPEAAAPGGCR